MSNLQNIFAVGISLIRAILNIHHHFASIFLTGLKIFNFSNSWGLFFD
ncbi:hypothetical protein NC99_24910 [Sunxiuqinia dokdonensis]|uniref:Uncharacterized protein n=1 Tax=Sunxiuqinia dokdonensis TaxID=1409788 RepID=A0A0L8V8D8_9BACT|nr:hypothetical protein NC99_24910 [Sunxiuqinia dokdonensis]